MAYIYMMEKHKSFLDDLERCGHVSLIPEIVIPLILNEFNMTDYLAERMFEEWLNVR
jgi:hypothetical protein